MIQIIPTDKFFYDSPDAGDSSCICSRCNKPIPEEDSPILRVMPTDLGDYGFDPNAIGGTEFRYCRKCSESMGIKYFDPLPEPDFESEEEEDNLDESCPNCGKQYDDIDFEYQICHYCKFNNNKSSEQLKP